MKYSRKPHEFILRIYNNNYKITGTKTSSDFYGLQEIGKKEIDTHCAKTFTVGINPRFKAWEQKYGYHITGGFNPD